jgi:hypothetical protein
VIRQFFTTDMMEQKIGIKFCLNLTSVLDDRRQAQHWKTAHKFISLSLQIVGELSTMFVR